MSNRVILSCTSFEAMPKASQWDDFFKVSGIEYEAKACIPIYWLCAFSAQDVHILESDHEAFDEDERPYAFLLCSRLTALARLASRAAIVRDAVGSERFQLYEQWMERLAAEPYLNVLVRTEELDWMAQTGELERDLRKALSHLESTINQGSLILSNAMRDIVGLWSQEELNECESFELAGNANTAHPWPLRFTPPQPQRAVEASKKRWWCLW